METESNQLINGEYTCHGLEGITDPLATSANDSDPCMQSNAWELPTVDYQHHDAYQNRKLEVIETSPFILRPASQSGMSNPTSSNVYCPPLSFQQNEEAVYLQSQMINQLEIVPMTLSNLNGTQGRTRNISASSLTSTMVAPSHSTTGSNWSGDSKRKRKYEIDDPTDPKVRNAKAAKMNRDKKKRQMEELQKKAKDLSEENQRVKQQLDKLTTNYNQTTQQYQQETERLNELLQEERGNYSAKTKQNVAMFDLIQKVISVLNPTPTYICMTERLATTQMPGLTEMESIRLMPQTTHPETDSDTHLTFKVGIGGISSITFDCE